MLSAVDALIAARYRLVRLVGTGGMGAVWEAWDERLHRPVALKQLHPQPGLPAAEAELANERALREARITARLHHRYAVPVFDVVEHDGQPCLVMQFLRCRPLSAVLRERERLLPEEAARVGAQVASALAAAHQADIVHRDVKPGNVLILTDGTAMISDFGISHALGDVTLTSTGMVHGTPAYLAPEVARGEEASFASDVFSLGATLYAAQEGAPPFGTDQNSIALLYRVASGLFPPPKQSGRLTPMVLAMLNADPDGRPSMREAAQALASLTASFSTASEGSAAVAPTTPTTPATPASTPPPLGSEITPPTSASGSSALPGESARRERESQRSLSATAVAAGPLPRPPGRRVGKRVWAAFAILVLVGLAVLAAVLVPGRVGPNAQTAGQQPARSPQSALPSPASSTRTSGSPSSASASTTSSSSPAPAAPGRPSPTPTVSPRASPSPTSAAPSSSAPPPVSGTPTARQLTSAIVSYYALMPKGTDQAWPRMTSSYQINHAGGRRNYQRFWAAIRRVTASGVTGNPPANAVATITYYFKDGRVVKERTAYRLINDNGLLKISRSTLLSSSTA